VGKEERRSIVWRKSGPDVTNSEDGLLEEAPAPIWWGELGVDNNDERGEAVGLLGLASSSSSSSPHT
jgi:hypothetical protein